MRENEVFVPVEPGMLVLDADVISTRTEQSVRAILRDGESTNTRSSYEGAMRYWGAWFGARYGRALTLPLQPAVIVQFIVDHVLRTATGDALEPDDVTAPPDLGHGAQPELTCDLPPSVDEFLVAQGYKGKRGALALNTIRHRIAVMSKAHQNLELENPCTHAAVKRLLVSTRSGYAARGQVTRQQDALTADLLDRLLATCDETPRGVRDRALLLFAWSSGGRRRSEVATAVMENLRDFGDSGYVYTLRRSKTNQTGEQKIENFKPIRGRAATALTAWLKLSGIARGPIFRRVIRTGRILDDPLSPWAVRAIVQERSELAGLKGQFSAHSIRSGFVTEAGRQGIETMEAMRMTGHRSFETFLVYYRAGNVLEGKAGLMMDAMGADDTDAQDL